MTNDQKFSNARALCERIQGIMASQTRSAFEATFNILSNVEVMIRQGRGEELADIVKQMSVSSAKKVECASKERKREFIFSSAPANLQVERRKAGKAKQSQALTKVRQRALLYEDSKKLKPPQLTEIGILLRQSTLLFRFCWQDDAMMLATVKDLPVYSIVAKPSSEEVAVPEVLIPTKVSQRLSK
ncbi:hypothetical protein PPTG_18054 [Phytophthora nicotianae INRA-310]|uniref:Uncharacterized protein n=1 Tax=Phytophthora nicotianae (strain INRA-310) TaxID=761204 RepID=W2PIA9_PHYN3|nr:hypothetical protein PPTG_18054 [Phytophthora nicotianae INRA-310]ETN00361.1 hypothetical protein PPTG_18054 [Phytophthora nicotianae INRA-310]